MRDKATHCDEANVETGDVGEGRDFKATMPANEVATSRVRGKIKEIQGTCENEG